MKSTTLLAAGALALSLSPAFGAIGFITDPGFEGTGPTFDGVPPGGELNTYEGFAGSAGGGETTFVGFTTNNPNSGSQSLELQITASNDAFAGVFQDVGGVIGGETYLLTGFNAASPGGAALGVRSEVRIEWFDGAFGPLGATPNLTDPLGAPYQPFSLSATAPAGAEFARVVYAIQTFGGEPDGGATNTGTVYVDDLAISGNFIPEPSTALLGALGMLGLLVRRRR